MTTEIISADEPDWSREEPRRFWDPGRKLLMALRDYDRHNKPASVLDNILNLHGVFKKEAVIRHWFWSLVTGCDIPIGVKIGGGLLLPHPQGIVIAPDAEIGPNCLMMQQVTLGTTEQGGAPKIGGHVDIGAGAKILGPVTIGDHALVGANAAVTKDVPPRMSALGVPAKNIEQKPRASVPPA